MLNNTVLDVAIGLIFVFLMLSVACSLLNERIQSWLDKRSAMLEDAIRKLLVGDAQQAPTAQAIELFDKVTHHAMVRGMAQSAKRLPSYLSSSTFALALFDALVPGDGRQPLTVKRLYEAIHALPESSGRKALLALTNTAEYDLAATRAAVERWFDNAMDRLSGSYKRHITRWIFALGFVVAAAVNADTIQLVQRFEHEDALRANVVDQATKAVAAGKAPQTADKFDTTDLLFWDTSQLVSGPDPMHPRAMRGFEANWSWLKWLWLKLLGFVMTGLAVTLGAPFWFDLLGRLINLRATGAKPAKVPEADV